MTELNCSNTIAELLEFISYNEVMLKVLEKKYDKEASKPEPDPEKIEELVAKIDIKINNIRLFSDEIKRRTK